VLWRNKDILLDVELLGLRLLLFLKLLSLAFIPYSVAASFPKMSLSKQRKVDKECRVFQHSWSDSYFFYGGECDTCMFSVFTAGFSGEQI